MELILNFLPIIVDHSYDIANQSLKIDIVGVGSSPSDWLDTFMYWFTFILATVIAIFAAIGIEFTIKFIRGEIVHESRRDPSNRRWF